MTLAGALVVADHEYNELIKSFAIDKEAEAREGKKVIEEYRFLSNYPTIQQIVTKALEAAETEARLTDDQLAAVARAICAAGVMAFRYGMRTQHILGNEKQ